MRTVVCLDHGWERIDVPAASAHEPEWERGEDFDDGEQPEPGSRWAHIDMEAGEDPYLLRDAPGLRLPHPGIGERNFVLVPLAEIAPDLDIPGLGRVDALAAACGREGLAVWPELP